jgi:PIN domain nuclease of toxin-antitoxin system
MRLLLDTHVWLWAQLQPEAISESTARVLRDPGNHFSVSTASTIELARLCAQRRVEMKINLFDWIQQSLTQWRLDTIAVSHEIAVEAYALPSPFHSDPADRLIVATARRHGLHVLTADSRILAYPHVATISAR